MHPKLKLCAIYVRSNTLYLETPFLPTSPGLSQLVLRNTKRAGIPVYVFLSIQYPPAPPQSADVHALGVLPFGHG